MKTLRPYQQKSIEILSKDTSGLDASEMGTGKTLVGVERVRSLNLERIPRVLIVAPVNTHRQWIRAFAEQYPSLADRPNALRIISTPGSDPESWKLLLAKKPGVFVIGWEAMRGVIPKSVKVFDPEDPQKLIRLCTGPVPPGHQLVDGQKASRGYGDLFKKKSILTVNAVKAAMRSGDAPPWHRTGTWDLVIADESHRMQRKDSANKLVIKQIKTNHKHASSGTPAGNREEGLWSTLNWLWPARYPAFWDWAEAWMLIEKEYIGNEETADVVVGEKHPGSTWTDIPCVVRWRLSQVADHLPDVIERIVEVPMGSTQRRIYDEFEEQALAWLDDHPVAEPLPISQRIRLRQAALGTLSAREVSRKVSAMQLDDTGQEVFTTTSELDIGFTKTGEQPKIQAIKEILSDLADDEPVLIFTHSAKWADMAVGALEKEFGPVRAWTGATSQNRREELKETFGKDVRIIVAVVAALSEGVDGLQYACRCEIWASPTEDGLMNEQAKARLHRPGQQHKVQRWLLHSENSIDTDVDISLRLRKQRMRTMYRDDKAA